MSEPAKGVFAKGVDQEYKDITNDDIKEMAGMVVVSDRIATSAGEIYLRTILQRMSTILVSADTGAIALAALDTVEAPMYDMVKAGALTTDIVTNPLVDTPEVRSAKAKEHNRRCNWARSIKSELKGAFRAGVAFGDIDQMLVSKKQLREMKVAAIESSVGLPSRTSAAATASKHIVKAHELVNAAIDEGDLDGVRALKVAALALVALIETV